MNEDGTMARQDDLMAYARKHGLKMVSIEQLLEFRKIEISEPELIASQRAKLPTEFGTYEITAYTDQCKAEHLFLKFGQIENVPLVRVHSECLSGDVFGSHRCDCGEQLKLAQQMIADEQAGIIIYLRQEGRGIGLTNKVNAYALQEAGRDTVQANIELGFAADERDFSIAAAILKVQNIGRVRLLTNNPQKISDLERRGIQVLERIPLQVEAKPENRQYLNTKVHKLNHVLAASLL